MNKLFIFLTLFSFQVLAQEVDGEAQKKDPKTDVLEKFTGKKELMEKIKNLKNIEVSKYPQALDEIYVKSKDYISFKEKQCRGEFSSLVIDENGREILKKIRLNKKEKKVCLLTLIKFRIQITESLFDYRKNFLKHSYDNQVKQLNALKERKLLKLNVMANKLK